MSDMTALLNDLSYIPPNNEHNEPTQGDIGETSNEPSQATRNEFEELYASANEELYPEFFQNVFPISKGYKLPPSYYVINKTFKTIGLGYESIHAYEHDCCLFRGDDNKDLDFCPVCNTSIWKDSNTPGKKVPKKCTKPGKMQYPVDSRAWKNFDTKYPEFAKEPRNVRLGLAADGFNPFGNLSQAYSMWPVILTTYNLPPWLYTVKARQDLQRLGIRSGLWLGQTENGKCLKPQAAYSFTPENQKKFCQFIKGAKLPDGFGSCFKHKQICSATLMEDDMLKAQIKVVDIMCDLELIYPPALFDIMIHLVIHLPLEALEGGPIHPRWMYPFKRYIMKKLKGYVQNKAKPEGSITEGYVAEEVLTFSSHYFWDVTTKFNCPDRNVVGYVNRLICQRHVDKDKDPEVSITSELFALACGPTWTPISINSCVVDGV
nr:hypothetical protein [Tanacetum cinerariifolium]